MPKYTINITTEDSELVDQIEWDTDDPNWDSGTSANMLGQDVVNCIQRAIDRGDG